MVEKEERQIHVEEIVEAKGYKLTMQALFVHDIAS